MTLRHALVCPGRGSYTEEQLGRLDPADPLVQRAEELRARYELPSLIELDSAQKFSAAKHLRPANVALLIWLRTLIDARDLAAEGQATCVTGNSMGWYTALTVAEALSFDDGFHLVQRMALLQEEGEPGGQVIYPVVDEEWQLDPKAEEAVQQTLQSSEGQAFPSIFLGGYRVLAGTKQGVAHCLQSLPEIQRGSTKYPFQLALHGPYHTPIARSVAQKAQQSLKSLEFRSPRLAMVDGNGRRHSPWSTDLHQLRDYTLGEQVWAPYDFSAAIRVTMREWAPDRLTLLGPGNSLGGPCAQILCALRWRGAQNRTQFQDLEQDSPVLNSLDR